MRALDPSPWSIALVVSALTLSAQAQAPEPRGAASPPSAGAASAEEPTPQARDERARDEASEPSDEGDDDVGAREDEGEGYRLREPGSRPRFGLGRGPGMRRGGPMDPRAAMGRFAPVGPGGCGRIAFERANASVVRVESGTRVGSGFVVLDASHVVTAFRIVRDGHEVRVVDVEGNARSARVVGTAPDDDLALLALQSPLDVSPLALAPPERLAVGMPIVALGHPWVSVRDRVDLGIRGEGLFSQSLSSGVVSALGPRSLSTDAQLASGSVGGPLLDCRGDVVGAVSVATLGQGERIYVAASSVAIRDLVSRAADEQPYAGRVRLTFGLGVAMAFEDPGLPMGVYGLVGLNAYDAFVLAARFHYLEAGTDPVGSDILYLYDQRYRGDAFVAWRQLVSFGRGMGFTFELGAGASVTYLQQHQRLGRVVDEGGIAALRLEQRAYERWAVRPILVLNVELGPIAIGYSVELDIDTSHDRYHVEHLFDLGARF